MLVLRVNVAEVLFMAGFIWTMQLIHHSLFDRVGADDVVRRRTSLALPGFDSPRVRRGLQEVLRATRIWAAAR